MDGDELAGGLGLTGFDHGGLTGFGLVNGQMQQSTAGAAAAGLPAALMELYQVVAGRAPAAVADGGAGGGSPTAAAGGGDGEGDFDRAAAAAGIEDGEGGGVGAGDVGRAPVARPEEIGLLTQDGGELS
jgi:hypothetical protein